MAARSRTRTDGRDQIGSVTHEHGARPVDQAQLTDSCALGDTAPCQIPCGASWAAPAGPGLVNSPSHAPHPFLAIEGVDGAGKTTVSRELATAVGAAYHRTPPLAVAEAQLASARSGTDLRDYIEGRRDAGLSFAYYLFGVAYAAHEISTALATRAVVCDRYFASTVAYHGVPHDLALLLETQLALPVPDVTFLLLVSEEERRCRIDARASRAPSGAYGYDREHEALREVLGRYRAMSLVEIDTSGKTVEAVVQLLVQEIRLRGLAAWP